MFIIYVSDAVWFALHICTTGMCGAKIPQNQEEAKTTRGEKRTMKKNGERMDVARFQAFYCNYFCLYVCIRK